MCVKLGKKHLSVILQKGQNYIVFVKYLPMYSTTVDKIITIRQILVFQVSKQPYQSARQERNNCK